MAPQMVKVCPGGLVGRLIGSGGETITRIRDATGTNIGVDRDCLPGTSDRRYTIDGTEAQQAEALKLIEEALKGDGEGGSEITVVNQHIREECKMVIGPRGNTIKAIRETTGCIIKVSDQFVPGTQKQTIAYTGKEPQVEHAIKVVGDLLKNGGQLPPTVTRNTAPLPPGSVETLMQVHEMYAGKIIGRAGQTVKLLSERSGCLIDVATDANPGSVTKTVSINGPPGPTSVAIAMVNAVLQAPDGQEYAFALQQFPANAAQGHAPLAPYGYAPTPYSQPAYAPPAAPTPPAASTPWREVQTPEGKTYYHNTLTNLTT